MTRPPSRTVARTDQRWRRTHPSTSMRNGIIRAGARLQTRLLMTPGTVGLIQTTQRLWMVQRSRAREGYHSTPCLLLSRNAFNRLSTIISMEEKTCTRFGQRSCQSLIAFGLWSPAPCRSPRTSPTSLRSVQDGDCITPQRRSVERVPTKRDVRKPKRFWWVKKTDNSPAMTQSLAMSLDWTRHHDQSCGSYHVLW